jgi:hypothetical protein
MERPYIFEYLTTEKEEDLLSSKRKSKNFLLKTISIKNHIFIYLQFASTCRA